ncbi:hypothetical protein APA_4537 [Pseudanabaena sp. lw0831]|nr:hypothetical protein APA_4537 [Pseudanabaena sp. lw0831]
MPLLTTHLGLLYADLNSLKGFKQTIKRKFSHALVVSFMREYDPKSLGQNKWLASAR